MNLSEEELNQGRRLFAASRVRQNAVSAGFAALCLTYFGFCVWVMPAITDLTSRGNALNQYTMRVGGIGMGFIALASLGGQLWVLIADAVLSALIGLGLISSSVMMAVGSGSMNLNLFLYIIFGIMFISVGIRNGLAYQAMHRWSAAREVAAPPPAWPEASMAEMLRKTQSAAPPAPKPMREAHLVADPGAEAAPTPGSVPEPPPKSRAPKPAPGAVREESPPPSEGYLASFANKKPRQES